MSTERGTVWSVTINNPTQADEECLALARQRGWKVEGQKEQGKEGTPHYQLLVRTPQVRFSALKRAFPRAHIELGRNAAALQQYVTKADTRVGALPTGQDKYPSLSKLWELIVSELNASDDYDKYFEVANDAFDIPQPKLLAAFDECIVALIWNGYHVETMGVNPQVRSAWLKYGRALTHRAITAQTDRQTDTALESTVSVPTIEHNNAAQDHSEGEASIERSDGGRRRQCPRSQTDPSSEEEGTSLDGEESDFSGTGESCDW